MAGKEFYENLIIVPAKIHFQVAYSNLKQSVGVSVVQYRS